MDLASGHAAAMNKLKKEHLRLKVQRSAIMIGLRGTIAYKFISEDLICLLSTNKYRFTLQ
jgi:hypothetical protein